MSLRVAEQLQNGYFYLQNVPSLQTNYTNKSILQSHKTETSVTGLMEASGYGKGLCLVETQDGYFGGAWQHTNAMYVCSENLFFQNKNFKLPVGYYPFNVAIRNQPTLAISNISLPSVLAAFLHIQIIPISHLYKNYHLLICMFKSGRQRCGNYLKMC